MRRTALVVALLFLASALATWIPVSAATPAICNVSNSTSGQTTSLSYTNAESSVSTIIALTGCNSAGTVMILTVWYPIASATAGAISPFSVADNASNVYTQEATVTMNRCVGTAVGGSCPGYTYPNIVTSWIAPFTAAHGHLSITLSSTSNFPYSGTFYLTWMFAQGLANLSVASSCTNTLTWDHSGNQVLQPVGGASDSCTFTVPQNGFGYVFTLNSQSLTDGSAGLVTIGQTNFEPNQQQTYSVGALNCTDAGPASHNCYQLGGHILGGTTPVSNSVGLTCQSDCDGVSIALVALGLGSTSSSPGFSITSSDWNPASTASVSGSSTYLAKETLYTYQDANGQTGAGTVYNFTTKVAAAHCAKVFCYLLVGFYMAQTGGLPPSISNPLLLQQPIYTLAIRNGTTSQVESQNVTVLVLPNYYWAVGIMSNSSASRGSGASGTGISVYQATWVNQMYGTSTVSTAFPVTTPPGIGSTPPLYFKSALTFPIVTTTSTESTTFTTGSYTTTTTIGTTTMVNAITASSPTYWYFPILFLGTGFTIFAGFKIMTRRGG